MHGKSHVVVCGSRLQQGVNSLMVHGLLTSFAWTPHGTTVWVKRKKNIRALQSSLEFHPRNSTLHISWFDYIFSETTEALHPYIMIHYSMGMSQHIPKYPMPQQMTARNGSMWSQTDTNKNWFELCHVAKASEGQCWAHEVKEVNLAAISRQHKTWLLQESLPCRKSLFVFVRCAVWGGKKLWVPLLNN